jgi:hypothetical protein
VFPFNRRRSRSRRMLFSGSWSLLSRMGWFVTKTFLRAQRLFPPKPPRKRGLPPSLVFAEPPVGANPKRRLNYMTPWKHVMHRPTDRYGSGLGGAAD